VPAPERRLAVPEQLERTLPALLVGEAVVFVARGEMDRAAMAALCRRARHLLRSGKRRFFLDLRRTPHLDYRALPALCRLSRFVTFRGGRIDLCGASPYLEAILRFAGLDFLPRHTSRAEALRSLAPEGVGISADPR
jgi:anti-anti-sigma regulatory factor